MAKANSPLASILRFLNGSAIREAKSVVANAALTLAAAAAPLRNGLKAGALLGLRTFTNLGRDRPETEGVLNVKPEVEVVAVAFAFAFGFENLLILSLAFSMVGLFWIFVSRIRIEGERVLLPYYCDGARRRGRVGIIGVVIESTILQVSAIIANQRNKTCLV